MGVAAMLSPEGLGFPKPTKELAHVGAFLGHLLMLSQNRVPLVCYPEEAELLLNIVSVTN